MTIEDLNILKKKVADGVRYQEKIAYINDKLDALARMSYRSSDTINIDIDFENGPRLDLILPRENCFDSAINSFLLEVKNYYEKQFENL